MWIVLVVALIGCGAPAAPPIAARATDVENTGVELGHEGLRGLEYGEPITPAAIEALLPGAVMRRVDKPGGNIEWLVEEQLSARGVAEAMRIHDNVPFGVQRHVQVRSPRVRTALGVRPGDRLGELANRHRVTCGIQAQTILDCHVPGTRFSLRTNGSGLTEAEMVDNVVDPTDHADHTIEYIAWLGPVRSRELRAQPLEGATVTRGGIGPIVRMPVDQLARHLPAGATVREQDVGDDVEIVVERDGRPFLRFEKSGAELGTVIIDSPAFPTALGVRVGDAFGKALSASSLVTCWVEARKADWRARCENGDVDLILEWHTGPAPGNGGDHATVPPLHVAADRVVEIRAMLH